MEIGIATTSQLRGGGFFGGIVIGYAMKKIAKLIAIVLGNVLSWIGIPTISGNSNHCRCFLEGNGPGYPQMSEIWPRGRGKRHISAGRNRAGMTGRVSHSTLKMYRKSSLCMYGNTAFSKKS
ncbi:MAG: hypothetical protein WBZ36_24935 [Candidatus Nitrosopolaris sp.]